MSTLGKLTAFVTSQFAIRAMLSCFPAASDELMWAVFRVCSLSPASPVAR